MCAYLFSGLGTSLSHTCSLLQQTSDNLEMVKEIVRRVQLLSSVLTSPVSEDDYAEKGRRVELRRCALSHMSIYQFAHPPLRKLEVVIMKLEPLSNQHTLVGFLRNIGNAGTLAGFVQELANAITDYQVRASGPTVIHNEHPPRF